MRSVPNVVRPTSYREWSNSLAETYHRTWSKTLDAKVHRSSADQRKKNEQDDPGTIARAPSRIARPKPVSSLHDETRWKSHPASAWLQIAWRRRDRKFLGKAKIKKVVAKHRAVAEYNRIHATGASWLVANAIMPKAVVTVARILGLIPK